ncbi:MAG TPA: hypothetical protein VNE21_05690 [Mycobacteriales bacterium]|nr:hypothetical protein [Mycobacteriales bacterium]
MGLGGKPRDDEFEWFTFADVADPAPVPSASGAAERWLEENPPWEPQVAERLLLVDLDNLRADAPRLAARMELVRAIARTADRVVLAGQAGSVARSLPWLGDLGPNVLTVGEGPDAADFALLDAALPPRRRRGSAPMPRQFAVASNDGIFAVLASQGPLTVLSPRLSEASQRLCAAATRVLDLERYEAHLAAA